MSTKKSGKVKWFNKIKGFGFIEQSLGEDVFFHMNALAGAGVDYINEGQSVEFIVTKGPKGFQAENITLV